MNPYAELLRVLPTKKKFIGEVTAIDASLKTSTILLLGGGNMTAKGIGTIGVNYLIEDEILIQELPSLAAFDITIY